MRELSRVRCLGVVMRPTKDNVFVTFEKVDSTSQGGIILQSNEDTRVGTVHGIGPDVQDVKLLDRIIADWSKGVDIGKGVAVIKEEYIQGIVNG
jgi:co-chaperonin GroES (HSP10)